MEMPLWFIYAILTTFFAGLNAFFQKVSAQNKNRSKAVSFYYNLASTLIALVFFITFFNKNISLDKIFWIAVTITAICNVTVIIAKMKGLKHLDSNVFFINLKFFLITTLFFIEIFVFQNSFSNKQIIGLIIGFIAFILLTNKSSHKKHHLIKGFLAITICIIAMTSINISKKVMAVNDYDKYTYFFFVFLFSLVISSVMNWKDIKSSSIFKSVNGSILYPSLQALFGFGATIFAFLALAEGINLAILSKMTSYSIFIPIFLSALIYKEKITLRKSLAFILTIISLWLFL